MGWLIALAVSAGLVALIVWLPVGVRVIYDENGLYTWYTVFSVRVAEVDLDENDKKLSVRNMLRSIHADPKNKDAIPQVKTTNSTIREFWKDLTIVLEFYWGLLEVAVVKRLDLKITMAGDDPCDLAIHYGQAQAAMGALIATLENIITIRKRNVMISCDFAGTDSSITARLDFSVSLGRVIAYLFRYVKNNIKK